MLPKEKYLKQRTELINKIKSKLRALYQLEGKDNLSLSKILDLDAAIQEAFGNEPSFRTIKDIQLYEKTSTLKRELKNDIKKILELDKQYPDYTEQLPENQKPGRFNPFQPLQHPQEVLDAKKAEYKKQMEFSFENLKNIDFSNVIKTDNIQKSLNDFGKNFPENTRGIADGFRQTTNNTKSTGETAEKSAKMLEEAVEALAKSEEILAQASCDVHGEITGQNFTSSAVPANYAQTSDLYRHLKSIGFNPTEKDFVFSPVINAGNTKQELWDALNKSTLEYIALLNKRSA